MSQARRVGALWGGAILSLCLTGCGGSTTTFSGSPCQMVCEKRNSCSGPTGQVPCDAICVYGGNYYPGLAPSPSCPNLAAQTSCVKAAVALSCDDYDSAALACPPCPVLDGSPCASDEDCTKYEPTYHCDLSRPGGYCTAPCTTADDCSPGGPEICTAGSAPSFDPTAPATQLWCLLGCTADAQCRTSDGYSCANISSADGIGTCDKP